jgi:excinuclease ABC subunit A
MDLIRIRGARTHNLQNVNLDLPRDRLIVITGLSGSGKSSLAFDTIYAEGQRRYVESLSAYARQFLSVMDKPDVDLIEGLSPAISIEQKSTSHNPRSTVGTVTEIYDYLRLLFARAGTPRCPDHKLPLDALTVSQMVDSILSLPPERRHLLMTPVVSERKGSYVELFKMLQARGFIRIRLDGELLELENLPRLNPRSKHQIDVVVDRFRARPEAAGRLAESIETALGLGTGLIEIALEEAPRKTLLTLSNRYACPVCGYSLSELEPRLFSFNNPAGACPACEGLGVHESFDPQRIVPRPGLSLSAGAIQGWDHGNPYYFEILRGLAAHYGFSLENPFEELSPDVRKIILWGSGSERIRFQHRFGSRRQTRETRFDGVIPNLTRRYRETDSDLLKLEWAQLLRIQPCSECGGGRLNRAARNVFVAEEDLPSITRWPIDRTLAFFQHIPLEGQKARIAEQIVKEIHDRLKFLTDVGLGYLALERATETLSGGEAQRIRLASQIGSGLVGVLYVLDEPSIGLHPRDTRKLLDTLSRLRNLGNTLLIVEHDEETIRSADFVVDMGPGAGIHGGRVMATGHPEEIARNPDSLTGQYLSRQRQIPLPPARKPRDPSRQLVLRGVSGNNLRSIDVAFPLGLLVCVTGVSGSGKSTLVNNTLYRALARHLGLNVAEPAPFSACEGADAVERVIDIDQSPIGRTPRSNPATYTGLFTPIRELYAQTPEARARGYASGRFSFNVRGGRCEACEGDGLIRVEMHFMPDFYIPCEQCHGLRYNRETLEIRYKGKTIAEVLDMSVEAAADFFSAIPPVAQKLSTLRDVGMGYVRLGQNATTLSGGEAQRIKLSRELSKRETGKSLYLLDEPTTGLHFEDISQLLRVLFRLRDRGNTVIMIEHHLDVIKCADWVIDLGPEGGAGGGALIAHGTPEQVAQSPESVTGRFLQAAIRQTTQPATRKRQPGVRSRRIRS